MSKRLGHFRPTKRPDLKTRTRSINTKEKELSPKPVGKVKINVLGTPIKSAADKKIYKTIKLPNGLRALLISDPSKPPIQEESSEEEASSTDTDGTSSESGQSRGSEASDQHHSTKKTQFDEEKLAACALCVGVGSYSDPKEIQGLAHFVEHMVFMGSSKYPKENEFDAFIKKKGGSDNASTDCEVTTFYFEIPEKYLPRAMDIFSQFFVSPLMKKEAMQREREAIESEFAIASPSDGNRKDQLLASMFPEDHPARTFTWGNIKSLKEDIDDEKLHKAAHEFRKRHYSAHRMTLAIQARMDLHTLEQYVIQTFGNIPNNQQDPYNFDKYKFSPRIVSNSFRSLYYMKPVGDVSELHLTWCMRSLLSEYKSKPHQYVSYLLGHEGKGSLLSYLRKKVWALGIYTGNSESGIDYTSINSLFSTQVVLTKDGLEHVDEVIEAIFSYLNMIRQQGPPERIYNEIKTIEDNSFRFEEESQPADYVETLSENMHFFPPEHYITGDRLYYKFDPEGIMEVLETMKPETVNVIILSNKHAEPIKYTQKEKWFGTEYVKQDVPIDWLQKWQNVSTFKDFHMPEKNIYIATNFDIIAPAQPYKDLAHELHINLEKYTYKELHNKTEHHKLHDKQFKKGDVVANVKNFRLDQPNLLRKNRHMELWYKPDFKWRFPTALLYFYFITPLSLKSPKDSCLLDLWNDVLQHGLKEEVYPADMADLAHSLYVGDKGLTLKVMGYSENLHLLVELITRGMRNATQNVSPEMFEAVRDIRARNYHNLLIKPNKLAKDIRMNLLLVPYISPRHKAAVINNITLYDLKEFNNLLLSKLYMQVLVQGNIPWDRAIFIAEGVQKRLQWRALDDNEFPMLRVQELPIGDHKLRVMSFNQASTNSIVTNYYQCHVAKPRETAILEVLMMLMEEPVFDTLRTKEQLGYSVFSMMRYTFGVLGFSISVNAQADKFTVAHVDKRIELFLTKFGRDMKRLNEKTLNSTKQSLVQLKHTTDYELKEEVERNWREITSREYKFHRLYEEADAIDKLTHQDLNLFVDNHFPSGKKKHYRKISVQVQGHKSGNRTSKVPDYIKNFQLKYLHANDSLTGIKDENDADFIHKIGDFKKHLPIMVVQTVVLAQC